MFAQPYISANIILDISEPPIECTQLVAQNKSIFDWSSVTRTVEVVKNFRANGENFLCWITYLWWISVLDIQNNKRKQNFSQKNH